MKAMILAAGLGTRLRPLTNDRPKALVEIKGKTLLEWVIRWLITAGCNEIIVNVHHFAGQIVRFIEEKKSFGIRIELSDEAHLLLKTGGGLKKAAWFFDDGKPFFLCNTDILTNLDLFKLYRHHLESNALATLAIRHRNTSRYLLFDPAQRLMGWKNARTGDIRFCCENTSPESLIPYAFSGIHVISPEIFSYMPAAAVFEILDVYLSIGCDKKIVGYLHDGDFWMDVGTHTSLETAEKIIPVPGY